VLSEVFGRIDELLQGYAAGAASRGPRSVQELRVVDGTPGR
jgi:hypothetical protein